MPMENAKPSDFRHLMEEVDLALEKDGVEGAHAIDTAANDPDDSKNLSDPAVFETLPDDVKKLVVELEELIGHFTVYETPDPELQPTAKREITKAGGGYQTVPNEETDALEIQITTANQYKIRS